ncbi:MAG TPA: DMT family transporter, partial [Phycisphaerales bacterium]|nr:DMT family transporter [Phycisphaerales bacterium]
MSNAAGLITVLLTLAGWSSVPLFLRHLAQYVDFWTSNGWRYGFAALLWAPVVVLGVCRRTIPRSVWAAAVLPAVFNTLGQAAFAWAHYKIDPGLLTFGLRTQIAFVAVGAFALFPSERRVIRSPAFLGGVLLVFLGASGTILLGRTPPRGATGFGVALAVASGALFAAYALSVRRFMHGVHPVRAFAVISLYTALGMVAPMLVMGERGGAVVLGLGAREIALLLVSAVIGISLGHVFYYISIARLGVAVTSGVIQLQPFLVASASYWLYGERLTRLQWASGSVAVAGAA